MSVYGKAIAAAVTSVIGLAVTYGMLTGDQAQQIGLIGTAIINLLAVYIVPNR